MGMVASDKGKGEVTCPAQNWGVVGGLGLTQR